MRTESVHPHPSHVCLDEDTLVLRAATPEGLARAKAQCAGCRACEAMLADVQRIRDLERELRESMQSQGPVASHQSQHLRVKGDALLASVAPASNPAFSSVVASPPQIRGYSVGDELHRGGQGVVYKGVQETTNRPTAIKLLLAGTLASLRERYRFEREIEIASSLRHPHIVAVFDAVSTTDGRMGYAMDFVDGEPIDQWGSNLRTATTPAQHRKLCLELMSKVCRAVQYAHSRGVMHRDLKPGNVLVDASNEPRLLDFGLARAKHGASKSGRGPNSLTMPGEFLGTPQYASPEQLELDAQEVDGRADVYALGMMLYQLICGRLPYTVEGSVRSIINTVCRTPVPRPSMVAAEQQRAPVDTDLETIILKALSKDRERRYQTALELAQDIDLLIKGHAIQARRESTWYVLRKWLAAHKVEAGAIAAVSLAVLGAIVGGTVFSARVAEAKRREAFERAQREEQAVRAQAVATVIAEILPPPDQSADAPPSKWLEDNLLDLREAIDAGWLSDRPELAAQVQSVLSDIYALRGTRSGWYAEATARNAKQLLREAHGATDPRVLRSQEAEVAALIARKRNVEGAAQAAALVESWQAAGPEWSDHVDTARVLLAQAQSQLGDLQSARESLALALPKQAPSAPSPTLARGFALLADLASQQGDIATAWPAAVQSLRMQMALRRDTDANVIASLTQCAGLRNQASTIPSLASELAKAPTATSLQELATALRSAEGERELAKLTSRGEELANVKRWLFGDGSMEEAESLALVGNSFRRTLEWKHAAEWTDKAGDVMRAAQGKDSLATMNLYSAAAEGYRMILLPQQEAVISEKAVRAARSLPDGTIEPIFRAAVFRDAASCFGRAGRIQEAISLMQEALVIFEEATGGQGHVVANACTRMGELHLIAGNNEEALAFGTRAYTLASAVTSMPVDQRVDMLGTYARALVSAGKGKEAQAMSAAQRALEGDLIRQAGWRADDANLWGFARASWTAACAARAVGDTAAYEELAAQSRKQWQRGMQFIFESYQVQPDMLSPWEQYKDPSLRP